MVIIKLLEKLLIAFDMMCCAFVVHSFCIVSPRLFSELTCEQVLCVLPVVMCNVFGQTPV